MKGIDLRPLKQWLQKGEIEEVANEIGVTPSQASYIISGRSRNFGFVEKILARVEKNKALKDKVESLSV